MGMVPLFTAFSCYEAMQNMIRKGQEQPTRGIPATHNFKELEHERCASLTFRKAILQSRAPHIWGK